MSHCTQLVYTSTAYTHDHKQYMFDSPMSLCNAVGLPLDVLCDKSSLVLHTALRACHLVDSVSCTYSLSALLSVFVLQLVVLLFVFVLQLVVLLFVFVLQLVVFLFVLQLVVLLFVFVLQLVVLLFVFVLQLVVLLFVLQLVVLLFVSSSSLLTLSSFN